MGTSKSAIGIGRADTINSSDHEHRYTALYDGPN